LSDIPDSIGAEFHPRKNIHPLSGKIDIIARMAILHRLNGTVTGLYLGLQPGTHFTTPQSEVQVTFAGFHGDQQAGLTRQSDGHTP
jgi:hypothetical protein